MWLWSVTSATFGTDVADFLYGDLKDNGGIVCLTVMPSDTWFEEIKGGEHFWTVRPILKRWYLAFKRQFIVQATHVVDIVHIALEATTSQSLGSFQVSTSAIRPPFHPL